MWMDERGGGEDGAMVRIERRPWGTGRPHGYGRSSDARPRGTESRWRRWGVRLGRQQMGNKCSGSRCAPATVRVCGCLVLGVK
jgi:hypothetical protein